MTLAPGVRLGPYEITAKLGAGGMGEVWRGLDTRLGRQGAIKVLPLSTREDRAARDRFRREALDPSLAALSRDPHFADLAARINGQHAT